MIDGDGGRSSSEVSTWLSDIDKAKRSLSTWHKRCNKIRKRYRSDSSDTRRQSQYQMLWANIETLKPAVFARLPQAVCSRRYRDSDPVGRVAGEMLERAVNFTLETGDYESKFKQVASNLVMYARGTARLRYEPVTSLIDNDDEDGLDLVDMDGPEAAQLEAAQLDAEREQTEVLDFEHVRLDFVAREDFIHPQARVWEELPWIAFRVFLTRSELVKRFGVKIGKKITLDAGPELVDERKNSDAIQKATIYEIWDKDGREVLWIAESYPDILDRSEPYLKLEGFFPCPRPAYGTITTDSLEPIPDYVYYQDQAQEIDKLTNRIDALADSLKLVGFYPGGPNGEGSPEIEKAVLPGFENRMISVKSWAAFTEGGKGSAPIVWLPIEMVADIIEKCIALRKELISDVWELTGVSDIMRGQGESDETATGVNAKSKFGMSRLSMKQSEMARFSRDVVRMVAEIVCDQFQPDTLQKMTNIMLPSQQDLMMAAPPPAPAAPMGMAPPPPAGVSASPLALPPSGSAPVTPPPGMGAPSGFLPGGAPASVPPPAMGGGPSTLSQSPSALPPSTSLSVASTSSGRSGASPPVTSDAVIAMLKDGVMRRFRIDIETDSTIASDEAQDRADRTEFIGAVTKFVEGWSQIIVQEPMLAGLAGNLLKFGARGFRIGRELEESIEEATDKLMQMASQPKPPPQPSPDQQIQLQIAQIKAQSDLEKAKVDEATSAANNQQQIMSNQFDLAKAKIDHARDLAGHAADMQKLMTPPVQASGQADAPPAQPGATPPAASAMPAGEPLPGARQAPDGHWYVPDAMRPGKHMRLLLH